MQLVSVGIGPDRVSDITANVLKQFLIDYTQEQASLWGIPVETNVPVENIFDFASWSWRDDYYELPVNRVLDPPQAILFVPRRLVRALPWINFPDFLRLEFAMFLRAKRARLSTKTGRSIDPAKPEIVAITRQEVSRIDRYVDLKERGAGAAQPSNLDAGSSETCEHSDRLSDELRNLPPGIKDAQRYQGLALRILNFLLEPDLIEGRPQVRTEHSTEIRDLIFLNDSDKKFWDFVRNQHGNLSVVFELKNKNILDNHDINQLAGYLGDPMGYFGILISRSPWADERRLKAMSWYNQNTPRRVIIHLSDDDLLRMLQMRCTRKEPTDAIRFAYTEFLSKLQ